MHPRYRFTTIRAAFVVLLATLGLARLAGAQPTITASAYQNLLTRSNTLTSFDAKNPNALRPITALRGGGHVFNFAETPFAAADTFRYSTFTCSASIPGCDVPAFASANVRLRSDGGPGIGTTYSYYEVQPSGLRILGGAGYEEYDPTSAGEELMVSSYTPASRELVFPLTSTSNWSDETTLSFTVNGAAALFTTQFATQSQVVAWGTLVTPGGSAPALMVRAAQKTTTVFGGNAITDSTITYSFVTGSTVSGEIMVDPGSNQITASYSVYTMGATAAEGVPRAAGLTLAAPAPNPARGAVQLAYTLDAPRAVTLTVHDALGREVARLAEGVQAAGTHAAAWDAAAMPAGVYLVRLHDDAGVQTRTVTVVH